MYISIYICVCIYIYHIIGFILYMLYWLSCRIFVFSIVALYSNIGNQWLRVWLEPCFAVSHCL